MYEWLKVAHLISLFLWIGGLFAIYWMLRMHVHAPESMKEKLTLMERSIALSTDIAATLAMGAGIAMIITAPGGMMLAQPGHGWLHIKLTAVVLGLLPMHGMLRAKIKRFGMGQIKPIGNWIWTVILVTVTVAVIMVIRGPRMFEKKVDEPAKTPVVGSLDPAR